MLIAVFAQELFGIQVAALATFYNIPYYIAIIILARWITRSVAADEMK
jgi:bile acid:Na+ symporter, BASS family